MHTRCSVLLHTGAAQTFRDSPQQSSVCCWKDARVRGGTISAFQKSLSATESPHSCFFLLSFGFYSFVSVAFAMKAKEGIDGVHMLPAPSQEPRTNSDLEPVFGPSVHSITHDNVALWPGICITTVEELCPTPFTPATMAFLTL